MNPASLSTDSHSDEEYVLPSVDALMAGTLALMTGFAQMAADAPQRPLMGKKLVSNLFFLAHHPQVSPAMRCVLENLRTRWQIALYSDHPGAHQGPAATAVWHEAHGTLQ